MNHFSNYTRHSPDIRCESVWLRLEQGWEDNSGNVLWVNLA